MVLWRMRWQQDGQLCLKAATVGCFVLFCIKLLRNIHLGAATVINLTAGGPSMCRKGFTFCIVPSNVQILTVLVFPVVRCLQNFKLSSFFDHFLWLWLKRLIHGFDKRGSFMFDPEQIYLHFSFLRVNSLGLRIRYCQNTNQKKHIVHFLYILLLVFNCCKSDSCFHDWWINHNLIGRPANTQQLIQGGFFNWSPPKKYVKPRLGESTLT